MTLNLILLLSVWVMAAGNQEKFIRADHIVVGASIPILFYLIVFGGNP